MKYRNELPQLGDKVFLTDGGLETTLVFLENIELPLFAAFDQLSIDEGRERLNRYFEDYIALAAKHDRGFVLESVTWRASQDWGDRLGYNPIELSDINREAINMLAALRDQYETQETPLVISGCVGPRGDGYVADNRMSVIEARDYHAPQINTFADSPADMVSAMTINYVEEAIGITLAAKNANIPVVISFTTETDGRIPSGETLQDAITRVDQETNNGPVYYMINCAHPDHFREQLIPGAAWANRIRAIRANASRKSHAELDESETLDRGNPHEFGQLYRELRESFPQLTVLGGCCGTDKEHIESVHQHCCD
ncbi:homocysteine S-methyltransferase family protein [Aurantivibrio plasticivorans]